MLGVAAGLGCLPCLQASAEPLEVPALSNPATGVHLVGKLIWLDLETTDLPGAKRFYRALFGWDYRDYHSFGVDYSVALANGKPVAGLVRRPIGVNETERRSAWLPFFSVADVGSTFALSLDTHAHVRSEPENLPLRGWQARLTDPEGAVFAIVSSSSGDPTDDPKLQALGTWGALTLLARDPGGEAVFYQKLFGYAIVGEPTEQGFGSIQLSAGTHERASVRPLPGGADALNPQWISFARVANTAAIVRQAMKLGAHVLVATTRAAPGAILTILDDPTGAAFGVIEVPAAVVSLEAR